MQTMTAAPLAPRLMEHRWGERIELDCPVRLELRDGTGVEGRLCNASISGAWIETGARLPARSLAYAIVNVIVPAGARHNVINSGRSPLKLYTLYGPPEHRDAVVHRTRREAVADDEHFDGTKSE